MKRAVISISLAMVDSGLRHRPQRKVNATRDGLERSRRGVEML